MTKAKPGAISHFVTSQGAGVLGRWSVTPRSENVTKMGNHSWGIHVLILFALFLPPEMAHALTPGIFYSDVGEFVVYWVRPGAATRPPTVEPC